MLALTTFGEITPSPEPIVTAAFKEAVAALSRPDSMLTSLQQLVAIEAALRKSFAQIVPSVAQLAEVGAAIPAALLSLMSKYNNAVDQHFIAAKTWLDARDQVPVNQRPDGAARPIRIPQFTLPAPTAGLGNAHGISAQSVGVLYGHVGSEIHASLYGYAQLGGAYLGAYPLAGLGLAVPVAAAPVTAALGPLASVGLFILLAVIIIVGAVTVINSLTAPSKEASRARTAIAESQAKQVEACTNVFNKSRVACESRSAEDFSTCIAQANATLEVCMTNLPTMPAEPPPDDIAGSILTFGFILALGAGGLYFWRRKQDADKYRRSPPAAPGWAERPARRDWGQEERRAAPQSPYERMAQRDKMAREREDPLNQPEYAAYWEKQAKAKRRARRDEQSDTHED